MSTRLPTKLKKEPIIDAVFEFRFSSEIAAAEVIPGYLYSQLKGLKVKKLPITGFPAQMLEQDPNLKFLPHVSLEWDKFLIMVGNSSVALGCKLPYPGWTVFKDAIIELVGLISQIDLIKEVHRYAIKYVDLIPADSLKEQINLLDMELKLGSRLINEHNYTIRLEIPEDGYMHVVNLISSAQAQHQDGTTKMGNIIDVDTIKAVENLSMEKWSDGLERNLNLIHESNKKMFFDCLKESTISYLEPEYV